MLKQRVITGLLLVVVVIPAILYLPFKAFSVATTCLMLFAAWEWGILIGCKKKICRFIYVICVGLMMFLALHSPIMPILYAGLIWWLIALYFIFQYPKKTQLWSSGVIIRAIMGILSLVIC